MKKFLIILLILPILLAGMPLEASADQAVQAGSSTLQAQIPLGGSEKKLETAQAAILYELNTDTLVYCWNPDQKINPTGMVKFLTVLIALEQGDLDAVVTVSRKALDSVNIGAVSAGLKRGEEITLRDLLYCVMVASANDAAAVIGEFIAGTQTAFVEQMNQRAQELGCTNSHFTNVHGLTSAEQYSTARDLAIIVEAALENDIFTEMFCAKAYTVPATNKCEARELKTTNHMISDATVKNYVDKRVTGGKPAAASTTDRSMICTAQVGTSRYLCVVMSAQAQVSGSYVTSFGNFLETGKLLDYAFGNYSVRQVIDNSQAFSKYPVTNGENAVVLQPEKDLFTVLPQEYDPENLEVTDFVDISLLHAPIKKGDVLGTLQICYESVILGSCSLIAMNDVEKKGSVILPADRFEPEPVVKTDYMKILIWVGIAFGSLILLVGGILLAVRVVRVIRIRRVRRRRMRQRRRSR